MAWWRLAHNGMRQMGSTRPPARQTAAISGCWVPPAGFSAQAATAAGGCPGSNANGPLRQSRAAGAKAARAT